MFTRIAVVIAIVNLVQGEWTRLSINIAQIVFFVYCKAVERYPLRLNGSQDSYSGELQVYINGSWGSFCYGSFSFTTAKTLCKTLGFKTAESAYRINITNTNTTLAVDRVYCYSNVDSFYNCSWRFHFPNDSYHYCYSSDTVGVVCSDGECIHVDQSFSIIIIYVCNTLSECSMNT